MNIDREKEKAHCHPRYLACERKGVFILLMLSAGMMGAYTFCLRGNVFCNAQTANVVMMAMAFGQGQWSEGFYYLIPMTAYVSGAFFSEILPNPLKKFRMLRWDTLLIGIEVVVLFIIGFIPLSAPDKIVQVIINFICSMQYNTFRQAEGIPMATTFCTNHVRQVGISLANFIRHKDRAALKRGRSHILMLGTFCLGGVVLTACCSVLQEKAIWIAILPLLVNFGILAHADLHQEHDLLEEKPAGH